MILDNEDLYATLLASYKRYNNVVLCDSMKRAQHENMNRCTARPDHSTVPNTRGALLSWYLHNDKGTTADNHMT